ncbi:hypothetical protein [Streptomyces flaveus]|uniref:hypothetical protein n=1 Tax=Streptomyces flaveus TaxID=66370 RepID=UPI003329A49A
MLVITGILAAVGCTPTTAGGGQENPSDAPLPGQHWAVHDGRVTAAEYRTAVARFISCVRDAGYTVDDPVRSPLDNLTLIYDITPSGDPDVYNQAVQNCNLSHLTMIEPKFVEAHPQVMDKPLRTAVSTCLRRQGISLTRREHSLPDFAASTGSKTTIVDCVTQNWARVYPELPATLPIRF